MSDKNYSRQMTANDIRTTIIALRQKFLDDAERRILHVETALSDYKNHRNCVQSAKCISVAAHRIAGLAPCLGFDRLGSIASRVEILWNKAFELDCSDASSESAVRATNELLDELESMLEPV